jgi:hypothetical protein
MEDLHAQKNIEALRSGIPPDGVVKQFTVGRKSEIDQLHHQLEDPQHRTLLIQSDYGTGKTHLLRYIREIALDAGYIVSLITLDAKSGIAFNKLDQVLGEINRCLKLPSQQGQRGVRFLFDEARKKYNFSSEEHDNFWSKVSNQHKWDYDHSTQLKSPAMYVALRAWFFGDTRTKDVIEDWLFQPANYKSQKNRLYNLGIGQMRSHFRDPRSERQVTSSGAFDLFNKGDYQRSWDALSDLNTLAQASGFRGVILLIDEFEDVISNITRKSDQHDAFWHLFEFFSGTKFTGLSFFAVTPDFVQKCKSLLIQQNVFDFDYSQFDQLPTFRLSSLYEDDLYRLSAIILQHHEIAYNWKCDHAQYQKIIDNIIQKNNRHDKVRLTIRDLIKHLDQALDE